MTVTCGQIVERALRRLVVVGAGEALSAGDLSVGMEALQEIIDGMRVGLFGRLRDVLGTDDMTAEAFDRVIANKAGGIVVTLPVTPDGEPVRDGSVVEVRDLLTTVTANWRYSADTARWERIDGLTAASAFPIGESYVGAIVARLALRLAPDFGTEAPSEVYRDAMVGARALARAGDSRKDWELPL
jgi:hypothetical protein